MIVAIVTALLLIPLLGTQFTEEVNWSLNDFLVMGGLLLTVGLAIEFVRIKVKNLRYRFLISLLILVIFLLVWAELAVGIFGTPFAGT